jgi:alkylation response protein AidB-like acyl-CoA dehydrogenase
MMQTAKATLACGGFLIHETAPEEIFTPEDFTKTHRELASSAQDFFESEVRPMRERMAQDPRSAAAVLRQAGARGLTGLSIPTRWGGSGMGWIAALAVTEVFGRDGSFSCVHGVQTGIGTLPLLLFGSPDLQKRYLPELARSELLASFALTESHSGSDALAGHTKAVLGEDDKHAILNGEKAWISNAGIADIFTVVAKLGDRLTAFLVEKSSSGLSIGAEEDKMGIAGSSTCPVYLKDVPVPADHIVGSIGRGDQVAMGVLNLGRLNLGASAVGAMKDILQQSIMHARARVTFGNPIASRGMIQHKLAEMTIRTFAAESMVYRLAGCIEDCFCDADWEQQNAGRELVRDIERYRTECSSVKVFCSEHLGFVADEGVQIHGGFGYHRSYSVERAFRDARIMRIFEGTNEINRKVIAGGLIKLNRQRSSWNEKASLGDTREQALIAQAKAIALLVLGAVGRNYPLGIEEEQEIATAISNIGMYTLSMESVLLRSQKIAPNRPSGHAADICSVYLGDAMKEIAQNAQTALARCLVGDERRETLARLNHLALFEPVDTIALRRKIANRVVESGCYLAL